MKLWKKSKRPDEVIKRNLICKKQIDNFIVSQYDEDGINIIEITNTGFTWREIFTMFDEKSYVFYDEYLHWAENHPNVKIVEEKVAMEITLDYLQSCVISDDKYSRAFIKNIDGYYKRMSAQYPKISDNEDSELVEDMKKDYEEDDKRQ